MKQIVVKQSKVLAESDTIDNLLLKVKLLIDLPKVKEMQADVWWDDNIACENLITLYHNKKCHFINESNFVIVNQNQFDNKGQYGFYTWKTPEPKKY